MLSTVDKAKEELDKLTERAQAASHLLGRPLYAAVLAVEMAPPDVASWLKEECARRGVVLVVDTPP